MHYLRETDVITVPPRLPTCWLQPISAFGCSFVNGTSRRQFTLHSPYHSILVPVRLSTGSYDSPHGSSYTSFIVPDASHHVLVAWPGRILEAELQVVLHLKKVNYNIYLCNFVSQITRRSGVFFKLVSDSDTRFKNICLELLVIGFSIAGGSGQFY